MNLYRNFTSQEEIDQFYNLAARTPDSQNWIEWYLEKSDQTRSRLEVITDVPYGPTLDETMDIFPASSPDAPILVFIHGGYWARFTSKDFSFVAEGLVNSGFTVAVTNYSLCPKVSISEITRQNRAAVAYLKKQNGAFNGDTGRIFVSGHSAGGHQVAMLLGTDWQKEYGLPADTIKGGISISGLFDLSPLVYSYMQPKLLLNNEIIRRESPQFNVPEQAPPLLISYGDDESPEFIRQSDEYHSLLQKSGLVTNLFVQENKHHFSAIEGLYDHSSALCDQVKKFIEGMS